MSKLIRVVVILFLGIAEYSFCLGFEEFTTFSEEEELDSLDDAKYKKSSPTFQYKPVHVRGYYRKDGTYVRPHYRSRPRRR